MTRALLAAALAIALSACGPADRASYGSLGMALDVSEADAARIRELQVELVNSSTLDCGSIDEACFASEGIDPVPFADASNGQKVHRAPFTTDDAGEPIDLSVTPGSYIVNVEALDADGKLVANACKLAVTFASGQSVDVDLKLATYTGPACDARM